MPSRKPRIFGPHEGESYRNYLQRLRDSNTAEYSKSSKAASMMVTVMMMQRGRGNQPMEREVFRQMRDQLMGSLAFKMMLKLPNAKDMIDRGDTTAMFTALNQCELNRQKAFDKYKRPREKEVVAADKALLDKAIEGLKNSEGNAAAPDSPEKQRRGELYTEMMRQLEHARSLAERGIQLSGEQTKALVGAVKAYNDGGTENVKPAGERQAEGFKECMALLRNYMPTERYNRYCRQINNSRGVMNPGNLNYVEPEAFQPQCLEPGVKTAKQLIAENRERMRQSFSTEAAAEAVALRQLAQGDPNRLIYPSEVEQQSAKLRQPGTAFMRAVEDPRARQKFQELADTGETDEIVGELNREIMEEARWHVVAAAQGEINRSIRRLTSGGPLNRHFTEQYLANILASEQLAVGARGDEKITNGAFKARAEELQKDPAFQRLAQRYMDNPAFRENMNRGLLADRSALSLRNALELERQPLQARYDQAQVRNQNQEQQPNQMMPNQMQNQMLQNQPNQMPNQQQFV